LWYKKLKIEFAEEAKLRSAEFADNRYFRKRNIPVVATVVLMSLTLITVLVLPPRDIALEIKEKKETFLEFKSGQVYFSKSKIPPTEHFSKQNITLPFRATSQVPGYEASSIWLDFLVEVPQEVVSKGNNGILVPMIWGNSRIFLNGELRDFGNNLFVVLPLLSARNLIQIRSDLSETGRKNPITATYPIVVGEIDTLRTLISKVDAQAETHMRSIAIYCLAIIVFGMLFLAYPRKPELLAFIVFMATSLLNAIIVTSNDLNFPLVKSFWFQQASLVSLDFFSSLALFVFSMYFLRAHPRNVRSTSKTISLVVLSVGFSSAYLFYRWTGSSSFRQVGHLSVNLMFFLFQSWFVGPRVVASLFHLSIPLSRKAACVLVVATIQMYYLANILDYFSLFNSVTTVYSNALLLNLALAVTVAFEISRAEHNQVVLGSMLPKEVKEALHHGERQSDQRGYVILVDAIGYAADRARFENQITRSSYVDALAQKILQPLNDLDLGDLSVLNCTGDGIYCAIRGPSTLENFKKALSFAESVTKDDGDVTSIGFRAAIGYGQYGVKVINAGKIRKEFVAGNVLNDLSRVIGSKVDRESIRVLISPETELFLPKAESFTVVDKHGFEHRYVPAEKQKRAA